MQHGDWRRWVAALLGRFLPKLRAAGNSGLFSWVFRFSLTRMRLASGLARIDVQPTTEVKFSLTRS